MSEVKRYSHNGLRGMLEHQAGRYVSYQDHAALITQRDALAAENAALKSAIVIAKDDLQKHYDTDGVESQDAEGNFMDACIRLCDAQSTIETLEKIASPATDAYLNSVRAEGVEAAIEEILQTLSSNHETILNELAAKLRASKDGE